MLIKTVLIYHKIFTFLNFVIPLYIYCFRNYCLNMPDIFTESIDKFCGGGVIIFDI